MSRFAMSLLAFFLLLPAGAIAAQPAAPPGQAGTSVRNARGQVVGDARAWREGAIVRLRLTVRGLTPGTHGVHLHETGRCDAPAFTSAGAHWNPTGRQHGSQSPQGQHLGDLPNVTIGDGRRGQIEFRVPNASLEGGANPLLDADGAAAVIHAGPDDYRTDPSGNSGGRIACGVLGRAG